MFARGGDTGANIIASGIVSCYFLRDYHFVGMMEGWRQAASEIFRHNYPYISNEGWIDREEMMDRLRNGLIGLLMLIIMTSCQVKNTSPTPELSSPTQGAPVIQTASGEWIVDSIRLVDEVHGVKAGDGQDILLILLDRSDGVKLTMEEFSGERQKVEAGIKGSDGNMYVCTMGGILDDGEIALGCIVPTAMEMYNFYWGENPIIQLVPSGA